MPESEEQKEIRRQQAELERSIREDGPTPIPDDPKPADDESAPSQDGEQPAASAFRQEEPPPSVTEQRQLDPSVKVVQNAGGDGLDDASTKEMLRELIGVAKSIQSELIQLGRG